MKLFTKTASTRMEYCEIFTIIAEKAINAYNQLKVNAIEEATL